jgi:hypothetical protein
VVSASRSSRSKKKETKGWRATSGAEGDSDGGSELLDAGLEGGSGDLVEGDILGRCAHHSPLATAIGFDKPRPAAGLAGPLKTKKY